MLIRTGIDRTSYELSVGPKVPRIVAVSYPGVDPAHQIVSVKKNPDWRRPRGYPQGSRYLVIAYVI